MFERYILSSPSLWFDDKVMLARERAYSAAHTDMRADVFLTIGAFETVNPASGNKRYHRNNDMVRDLRAFEAQLRSRRYPSLRIKAAVIDDEDHLTVYPAAITRGLMCCLPFEPACIAGEVCHPSSLVRRQRTRGKCDRRANE